MDELAVIEILKAAGGSEAGGLGIGDDGAVLGGGGLVTCDTMVEGVHFDLNWMDLGDAAYRCLAANLSDIAAMGGKPGAYVLSLGVPWGRATREDIEHITKGLIEGMADGGGCLVGGDTVRAPCWVMTITLLGRCGKGGAVLRSGAQEGDLICVFKGLGDAAAGLAWLQAGHRGVYGQTHRRPRAEVALGAAIGDKGCVHGMLDISDGLGIDLARMLTSSGGLGAEIFLGDLPLGDEASALSARLGVEPWPWVIGGGEDYTLCAAVGASQMDALREVSAHLGRQVFTIGKVLGAGQGLRWYAPDGSPYKPKSLGYVHGAGGDT